MDIKKLGFGLGLRAPHYDVFLNERPKSVDWLEIISDNYINAHKGYWEMLSELRKDYPFVMHGVSLSIGSIEPVDLNYLKSLRKLADFLEVEWISDHLCYTGINKEHTHDLLPIPYTEEALKHLIPRIHKAQEIIGRTLVFENSSSYLEFEKSTISEPEFLNELHKATGCNILLDINNVYVSSFNHGWDACSYIDAIPSGIIQQYHLAGHANKQTHLIDSHGAPIINEVWNLFSYTIKTKGLKSTMIEWDSDIPEFSILESELEKAKIVAKDIGI